MSTDGLSSPSLPQILKKMVETITSCGVLLMEATAQLSVGQAIFRLVDRFLWVMEKSFQWSLPSHELIAEENGKTFGKLELVRPLPWIFFLVVLINLRIFRMGLNIGSLILGYPRIEPAEMVRFLQKIRRRLRAIKSNGLKNIRLQTSCSKPSTLEEQSTTESTTINEDPKRKYSELSSDYESSDDSEDEETIQTKIDRLAINDSTNDEDFNCADLSSLEDDEIVSSSNESEISETEIEDLRNEANLILQRTIRKVTEVETEETEVKERIEPIKNTGEDEKLVYSNAAYTTGSYDDFCSPSKLGEEAESAFYSPIGSTSPSPDRMVSNVKQEQHGRPVKKSQTENSCQNGEKHLKSGSANSGTVDKRTNGHVDEKVLSAPTHVSSKHVKSYHRGRRANNGSRKKK
ncbi:uncharacterized protein Jabba isoform X3 [Venturia canescens]|uniref:uncharacterized protein Jabba isoform X3 n=1 Tax=Venturia canescens TaxID=32260 RepID=UPI001C9D3B08|nr:uncharacterized protein LOC122418183 isoform X3 [Venturia canescens]